MQDEIDLLELFMKFVRFLKREFKMLLLLTFAGAIIGALVYFVQSDKNLYTVTGYSPIIKNSIIIKSISKFSSELKVDKVSFCKSNDLNIELFDKLVSIDVIENEKNNEIDILLTTNSLISINDIIFELNKYISKNSFINKSITFQKDQLNNTIQFLNKQIEKIESKDGVILTDKNGNVENSAALLYIDKNKYEESLTFLEPFIITNISEPENIKPSLLLYLLGSPAIAILLFFVFSIIKKINQMAQTTNFKSTSASVIRKSA